MVGKRTCVLADSATRTSRMGLWDVAWQGNNWPRVYAPEGRISGSGDPVYYIDVDNGSEKLRIYWLKPVREEEEKKDV